MPTPRPDARRASCLVTAAALLLHAALLVHAECANAGPVRTPQATAELVAETTSARPGEPFTVALSLVPEEGWHTYWVHPGDSGLPTRLEWKLPPGLRAGPIEWPHPVQLTDPPVVTYGYERDVLLPVRIDGAASAGGELELAAVARWLACRDDGCVPGKAELSLRVRVDDAPPRPDPRWAEAFANARAKLPRRLEGWSATASADGENVRVHVTAPGASRDGLERVQVFATQGGVLDTAFAPLVRASGDGLVIEARRAARASGTPEAIGLVLVRDGGWGEAGASAAVEVDAAFGAAVDAGTPSPVKSPAIAGATPPVPSADGSPAATASAPPLDADRAAPAPAATPPASAVRDERAANTDENLADTPRADAAAAGSITFWVAVVLAFLGGLVLNLMPCVFPVLSLKVLGFVHVAHHEPASVRRHGYAFTAGVMVSFWILAGALLLLRAAGSALGWGFQLQEPAFVAAIAALLTAMSLNLFGVFELGATISGAVGRFDSEAGYRGSFLSGVLATVLATPCSAPFMGTALGYALVQPPLAALAVFTALGAGMAAPYLVFSCAPVLLRALPRPGEWMETFRILMAFPLLATVAWLVWVFGQQTGNDGVLRLLMALLLGSLAIWLATRFRSGAARAVARTVGAACVAAGVLLVAGATRSAEPAAAVASETGAVAWQAWDPSAIERHRSEGRLVFVDFTADWCLSCKVNERVALSGDGFAEMLRAHEAVAMKADWTRADPRITEALAEFGRNAVPLYVVYPPDPAREPIVLPQILTPGLVRDAFERAVG